MPDPVDTLNAAAAGGGGGGPPNLPAGAGGGGGAPNPPKTGPGAPALITAAILLLLYVGLTIAMIAYFAERADDPHWARELLIYNSFMSFAVAAGGVLLGTQIQQGQVVAARQQVADAKQDAIDSKQAANKAKQAVTAALAATHADPAVATTAPMTQVRAELLKAF